MAAASGNVAGFAVWLRRRLEEMDIDGDVYGSYINGILLEGENEEEQSEALQGILSTLMDEDSLKIICKEIIQKWCEITNNITQEKSIEDEVHTIASMIEKQAQIIVKQKGVSETEKPTKAAVLAQYANITDEEDDNIILFNTYNMLEELSRLASTHENEQSMFQAKTLRQDIEDEEDHGGNGSFNFDSDKSLFKNTNIEAVLVAKKAEREKAREDAQKKKEQDKLQREKDKLAKQERKDKEKKRTQKGERKR